MLEFLRVVSDEQVTLLVRDPNSAGELRPGTALEGSSYRYVVMPMRI
jgi:DNA polymerase III sliding clamp (beta) subunit (PCNA family)